jgi:hypothetical protein
MFSTGFCNRHNKDAMKRACLSTHLSPLIVKINGPESYWPASRKGSKKLNYCFEMLKILNVAV